MMMPRTSSVTIAFIVALVALAAPPPGVGGTAVASEVGASLWPPGQVHVAGAAPMPGAAIRSTGQRLAREAQATLPIGSTPLPDTPKMIILIRTTIIALNQANKTNNYTVLHELAAPSFQEANSPERLSELFQALRERDLDLGPTTVISPQLFREPALDDRGRLRLTGFFPSRPEQVNFDLAFEMVDGDWRLFGIGVNTSREEPAR